MGEIHIVTFWEVLIMKAKAMAKARISGDAKEFKKAEDDFNSYKALVLMSTEVVLPGNQITSLPPQRTLNYGKSR